MPEGHRFTSPTKQKGAHYTPDDLAQFLASQAFDAHEGDKRVRILDPACGDGALLSAAHAEAIRRGMEVVALVGFDIDAEAATSAERRLAGIGCAEVNRTDFLEQAIAAHESRGLFGPAQKTEAFEFDIIVSNPPYVRQQTARSQSASRLAAQSGLSGRYDLYEVFAAAMIDCLAPLGALGLLCSNKFLTNRSGRCLRRLLARSLRLHELVDLGDTKMFDAAVLPVIASGVLAGEDHRRTSSVRFRSVYEVAHDARVAQDPVSMPVLQALSDGVSGIVDDSGRHFEIREGQLRLGADPDQPWVPMEHNTRSKMAVIERGRHLLLGQIGHIRVGVKTHADSVFIRSDWAEMPEDQRPESDLLRPLLTHREIDQWSATPSSAHILYPYEDRAGRAALVDFSKHPRAMAYLHAHRDVLEKRSYVTAAGREWYEIWVPQRPSLWALPKVVFPDIASTPRFAVDRSGAIVNGDCYWLIVDDPDVSEVVAAVGNSSFCTWFYDTTCGNRLYAGRRRFMTQYMTKLPIPGPIPALADEIRSLRAAGGSGQVDALIWSAFGLSEPTGRQAKSSTAST